VLNDGAEAVFDFLQQQSIRIGVITNGFSLIQRRKISRLAIANRIDTLVISEEVGAHKPDHGIFRFALQSISASPIVVSPAATWHVGDHLINDIAGASTAGIRAILYDPQRRYDRTADTQPDDVIYHFDDLLSRLG
jgi:putative hydrolase of the HAD superfamily